MRPDTFGRTLRGRPIGWWLVMLDLCICGFGCSSSKNESSSTVAEESNATVESDEGSGSTHDLSRNEVLSIWKTGSFDLERPVNSVTVSPDKSYVAAGTGECVGNCSQLVYGTASIWKTGSKGPSRNLERISRQVSSVRFSPDGEWLLAADCKSVLVFSVKHDKVIAQLPVVGSPTALAFRGFEREFSIGGKHPGLGMIMIPTALRTWTSEHIEQIAASNRGIEELTARMSMGEGNFPRIDNLKGEVSNLAYVADGKELIIGGFGKGKASSSMEPFAGQETGLVSRYDVKTAKVIFQIRLPGKEIKDVAVSSDERWLAYCTIGRGPFSAPTQGDADPAEIRLADATTGRKSGTLTGATRRVNALAFCPGHDLLAAADEGGWLHFWNPVTQAEIPTWITEDTAFRCLAFSSDGSILAAGTAGGKVLTYKIEFREGQSSGE